MSDNLIAVPDELSAEEELEELRQCKSSALLHLLQAYMNKVYLHISAIQPEDNDPLECRAFLSIFEERLAVIMEGKRADAPQETVQYVSITTEGMAFLQSTLKDMLECTEVALGQVRRH